MIKSLYCIEIYDMNFLLFVMKKLLCLSVNVVEWVY